MKTLCLAVALLFAFNVLSWAILGKDRALVSTAQFIGEGNHGPQDTLLVFARYRGVADDILQPGDFSQRARADFLAKVRTRRSRLLRESPYLYHNINSVVEYRDELGDRSAASVNTARFAPLVERVGFLTLETSGRETLSDGGIYSIWHRRYWWVFGWREIESESDLGFIDRHVSVLF